MMLIRDVNSQVEKAIAEIERTYSKGMTFTIYDLSATSVCWRANNFSNYKNSLQSKLILRRVAQLHSTRDGVNVYIKL